MSTTGNWSCVQLMYLALSTAYLPKTRKNCWGQIVTISRASKIIPAILLKQEK